MVQSILPWHQTATRSNLDGEGIHRPAIGSWWWTARESQSGAVEPTQWK